MLVHYVLSSLISKCPELIFVAVLKYCPTFESQCKSCFWWHVIRQRAPMPLKAYHHGTALAYLRMCLCESPQNATVTICHTCSVLLIMLPSDKALAHCSQVIREIPIKFSDTLLCIRNLKTGYEGKTGRL